MSTSTGTAPAVPALGEAHAADSAVDDGEWAHRHPAAARLSDQEPGPGLADEVAALEPADLDDAALVEAVAAWERLGAWVAAGQARMVAELDRRRSGLRGELVQDEIAARLHLTRHAAEGKVAFALGMERLPVVADALGRGDLDVARANVLADELVRLPEHVAHDVAVTVLPVAITSTPTQLRGRLRRMELVRDPEGAVVRHRRACEERRVELVPAPDAMAWVSAYLPAPDAVALHTALTALADRARGEDDGRTLDQRRADALVDLGTRCLDAGTGPDGTPLPTRQGRRPHLVLTATAEAVLGLSSAPAVLDGYGVVPAAVARAMAARSTWEPLLVAAGSGEPLARATRRYAPTQALRDAVVDRDRTCTFPGCRVPAARCDVDHVTPFDPLGPADQTRLENLQALCRHHHRAKTHAGWSVRRDDVARAAGDGAVADGRAEGHAGGGLARGSTTWRSPTGHVYVRPAEHPSPDDGRYPSDAAHPPPPF